MPGSKLQANGGLMRRYPACGRDRADNRFIGCEWTRLVDGYAQLWYPLHPVETMGASAETPWVLPLKPANFQGPY
jgi:hypothetical protein